MGKARVASVFCLRNHKWILLQNIHSSSQANESYMAVFGENVSGASFLEHFEEPNVFMQWIHDCTMGAAQRAREPFTQVFGPTNFYILEGRGQSRKLQTVRIRVLFPTRDSRNVDPYIVSAKFMAYDHRRS